MKRATVMIMLATVLLSACSTLGYYTQAIGGQLDIANRAEPIDELLTQPQTPPALRARLKRVVAIRQFASDKLALPDNDSYRRYADLGRPYAVWNVFAAPSLSVEPKQWCFLILGCVSYRGYFDRNEAERFAAALATEGYDVYVAGIPAFSTLGWFADPVLNTFVNKQEASLAGLIFHELAHQQLYIKNDSAFNESFATVVEREGVRRWAIERGDGSGYERYRVTRERQEQFAALILTYRERLDTIYRSDRSDEDKRRGKTETIRALKKAYREMKARWGGWNGYDVWFDKPINNAQLASVGLYHVHVAALQRLLAAQRGDLPAFYRAAQALADRPRDERTRALAALTAAAAGP